MGIVKQAMEGHFEQSLVTLSVEELDEMQDNAESADVQIVKDLDEAERTLDVVGALEDLAFVASTIEEVSPREAALIQIAADASMVGTGVNSSAIFPAMEDMNNGKNIAIRIEEVIRRIIEEVKALMIKIRKQIANYLNVNLQLAQQRKAQIKELQKLAEKTVLSTSNAQIRVKPLFIAKANNEQQVIVTGTEMVTHTRAHVKNMEMYISNASRTLENIGNLTNKYFQAVADDNKEVQVSSVVSLRKEKLLDWFNSFPKVEQVDGGFEVNHLLMGLRLSAGLGFVPDVDANSDAHEIATAFSQGVSGFTLRSSISSLGINPVQIDALTLHEIDTLLALADDAVDQCLDKGKSLLTELSIRTEAFEKIATWITQQIKSSSESLSVREAMPHFNIAESVIRRMSNMPYVAFNAAIIANLRLVGTINGIVRASIEAHTVARG